jgi:hypothetical protein
MIVMLLCFRIHKPVGEKPFHFVNNNNTPVLFTLVFVYIKYAHVVYLIVFLSDHVDGAMVSVVNSSM